MGLKQNLKQKTKDTYNDASYAGRRAVGGAGVGAGLMIAAGALLPILPVSIPLAAAGAVVGAGAAIKTRRKKSKLAKILNK